MQYHRVLVLMKMDEQQKERVRAAAGGAEVAFVKPKELTRDQAARAEVIIGWPDPGLLAAAGGLKLLQLPSSGVQAEYLRINEFAPQARLCSATGSYGTVIAEYMLGALLMLMKRLQLYRDDMRAGAWTPRPVGDTLAGARVLSVGMGDIGTAFSTRCALMGAEVTGIRRRPAQPPRGVRRVALMDELDTLLPQADVVALSLPETEATRGLMGAARFARMKRGSYLINVGRGSAVDQAALLEALASGRLAGAAADVTVPEPLPADHPLWQQPNLLITPHIAGQNFLACTQDNILAIICDNLRALREDAPLRSLVDVRTGYRA